jgi:hypothetical protein
MAEQLNPYFEYLEANKGIITDITGLVDQYLDQSPPHISVVATPDQEPRIVRGESTPEEVMESAREVDAYLSLDDAADIAHTQNRTLMGVVVLSALELQSAITKYEIARRYQENPELVKADALHFLTYSQATYDSQAYDSPHGKVTLKRTTMEGIEPYQTAIQYTIDQELDGLVRASDFIVLDGAPIFSHSDTNMSYDPLFERAYFLLPEARAELALLLSGTHKNQDDILQTLGNVWQKYVGTSKEVEVSSLLEELHARGEAILAEFEMARMFDTERLSVDQLRELRRVLSD